MFADEKNNRVYVRGVIVDNPVYSHTVFAEEFYEFFLSVPRLSGQNDLIPITISEKLIDSDSFKQGCTVTLLGQFRSYNKLEEGRSKLILTLFVRQVLENDFDKVPNTIILSGYLCKKPLYRTTPFNREIADLLIAVNRSYNKSDYLPCIAWGRNARFAGKLEVGTKITVAGRIQSREYTKKLSEEEFSTKTAFEISISKLSLSEGEIDELSEYIEARSSFDPIDEQGLG